ncbi:ArnT family glycosyltransferase [Novosphingobium huizhouense]|uniref:ArnT family glycosyltransferase n=1 Tax=Novosphingobium huizhouense TaxID=2866625 RepID=UPI001CD8C59A|nr:glycosyltransferase family 39 protein [Novosphingobium huizhouense]
MATLPPLASSPPRARLLPLSADAWTLLAIVAASLLLRIWWFGSPVVDHDEQFYSLVGREMLAGKIPYVDVWDRKPIGLFLIFAAAHALLGASSAAYLIIAELAAVAGAWLVYRLATVLADARTARVAALLHVIAMFTYGCRGGQAELFFTVPCLAMTWLLIRHPGSVRAMAVAMLLGGIAIQIKSSAAPFCLVFGLAVLFERWRLMRSWRALAGEALLYGTLGLAPTLLAVLVYAALGHLDAYLYANFVSVFDRPVVMGRWSPKTPGVIGPIVLAIASGVWAFFRTGRSYPPRAYAIVAVTALGTLAGIYATQNVLAHYYAFLVPWALLLAVPFMDLRARAGRWGAVMLCAAFVLASNVPARLSEMRADRAGFARLAALIGRDGQARGLYVFTGPVELYPATGNDGGRYPYPSHHSNQLEMGGLGIAQRTLVEQALARHPAFILARKDYAEWPDALTVPLVEATLQRDYRPVGTASILGDDLVLYRRR